MKANNKILWTIHVFQLLEHLFPFIRMDNHEYTVFIFIQNCNVGITKEESSSIKT